jgi:hypothetical protein
MPPRTTTFQKVVGVGIAGLVGGLLYAAVKTPRRAPQPPEPPPEPVEREVPPPKPSGRGHYR